MERQNYFFHFLLENTVLTEVEQNRKRAKNFLFDIQEIN